MRLSIYLVLIMLPFSAHLLSTPQKAVDDAFAAGNGIVYVPAGGNGKYATDTGHIGNNILGNVHLTDTIYCRNIKIL